MPTATAPDGYHGCYRRIDVGRGTSSDIRLDESILRRFIGGAGLGTYLLLCEKADQFDPLSPAAPLAFVFSPLVGSPLTTSAKFAVVSRSPLTNRLNDSLASSALALAGKRCGADAMVIVGRAAIPSILVVDDDRMRVEPAEDVWGLSCAEATDRLRMRLGEDFQIAAIGLAGERQVRFATISHDGRHAGRGGSGAVLGSKNIKALAVRGSRRTRWAFPVELTALARDISARSFGPATAKYRELGTAANLLVFNRLGVLPTRNFQQGSFAAAADLSPEQLSVAHEKTRASCAACTIGCEHIYSIAPSNDAGERGLRLPLAGVRIEYENLFALGPLCGISDSSAVLAASQKCDALGIDTISAGGTIAFAMECVERGLLDAPWLKFGDATALHRAIDEIGHRSGLGDRLAEGSRRLALELGGTAIDFAPQVKGLEIPGYEPRALQMMALGFAVGIRGADHNRSGAYEVDFSEAVDRRDVQPEDSWRAVETEDKAALMDSLILCKFLRGIFADFSAAAADMLHLVTGWDVTAEELRITAARIMAAKKLLNIRSGWQPKEDTLPARFLEQPLPSEEEAVLTKERLATLVKAYNRSRGYTSEGWIPEDLIAKLGLQNL